MSAVPHDESASSTLVRDDLVIDSESTWEGGRQAFQTAWMAGARPTAVLAMSDIVALGAASAAGALRLAVPADLSIVGFDDIPSAADPPRSLHIRFLVCILLYPPRHHCALRGAGNRCARSETLFSTRFLPPRFQATTS